MNTELAMSVLYKCLPHGPDDELDYEESKVSYGLEDRGLVELDDNGFLVTTPKGEAVLIGYREVERARKRGYAEGFAAGKASV